MKTFSITTLGCRVNHYEGEQLAALLRGRGLVPAPADRADLRIVHTCSVTVQAASKSRQSVRRSTRLHVLPNPTQANEVLNEPSHSIPSSTAPRRPKVVVTGCWATSNPAEAAGLPGVDAVLGHEDDVAGELSRLLGRWQSEDASEPPPHQEHEASDAHARSAAGPKSKGDEGWMIKQAGTSAGRITGANGPHSANAVKRKLEDDEDPCEATHGAPPKNRGMTTLPQLAARQSHHQRAFLKVQDGCDAHCTYCIIPQLRPVLWSKPVDEAVDEARRLIDAGHVEVVLTGIFLGAYAQPTALRRRQPVRTAVPLGRLIEALCTRVHGLRRLRLSSMEPGDLTPDLLRRLRSHPQVVPHFHLPLQSGSDALLRKMNRQYTRTDFLEMVDQVHAAFDRPAITTDIIVGFPGETDAEFGQTLDVVDRVRFIHTHAFSYSVRPNTAAARWTKDFVRGPVVNDRIDALNALAAQHGHEFRKQFLNETAEVLVEQGDPAPDSALSTQHSALSAGLSTQHSGLPLRHGRSERYFPIHFPSTLPPGAAAKVRIREVTPTHTFGTLV